MNGTGREPCERGEALVAGARPLVSALMFSAGLLGNLLALGLLLRCRRPPRARPPSLFHVLVLALVVTDLLGTCSVSPFVLASYHRNLTLTALARGGHICLYFGFAMSFFGLATMLILFAMALERCLALGRPYFYERFLSPRTGSVALPAIYTFAAAFCSLPLVGFGRYVQYCPGTWCFIQMYLDDGRHAGGAEAAGMHVTFSLLYATLLLLLILSVLLCNLSVISNLARMHRRGQKTRRLATPEQPRAAGGGGRCMFSMAEEIDHLLLLAIMTITFVICSLPFTKEESRGKRKRPQPVAKPGCLGFKREKRQSGDVRELASIPGTRLNILRAPVNGPTRAGRLSRRPGGAQLWMPRSLGSGTLWPGLRLHEQVQQGQELRLGSPGAEVPLHQPHPRPLGLRHPAATGAAGPALGAVLPAVPRQPGRAHPVPRKDETGDEAGPQRAVDPPGDVARLGWLGCGAALAGVTEVLWPLRDVPAVGWDGAAPGAAECRGSRVKPVQCPTEQKALAVGWDRSTWMSPLPRDRAIPALRWMHAAFGHIREGLNRGVTCWDTAAAACMAAGWPKGPFMGL
nr:prostaglandin D2 receptor isoform X1 [Anser cygnoides]